MYILFNIIFVSLIVPNLAQHCNFKYATDFPDKEPVLLWSSPNGRELITPHDYGVDVGGNENIVVACPGARNSIVNVHKNLVNAKCVTGQTLNIGTRNLQLKDLECRISVTGEFKEGTQRCGNEHTGIIKHIGHDITTNEFKILFNVCYDNTIGGALYADHTIYGSAITFSGSSSGRPSFKVAGLAPGVNADGYKQTAQKATFANLLGNINLANHYIHVNSYLARGHLAPDKDMVFVSSQHSTYFYINTVPQWQQINNGNWKSLELSLRNVAAELGENFQVFTGSYKVLELPNINRKLVKIYLSGNKLPVPKFIWKVFYSLQTKKAIAFVSVNNPFLDRVTPDLFLCKNVCDTYKWGKPAWKQPEKGLIYCCKVDDLRKTVGHIPQLHISGVQENKF